MTPQQMFDTVLNGIRSQGGPSISKARCHCLYRGQDGRKCAAGWLIADERYHTQLEGHRVTEDVVMAALPLGMHEHYTLMRALQQAHDNAPITEDDAFMRSFEADMRRIAEYHGLQYKEPTP